MSEQLSFDFMEEVAPNPNLGRELTIRLKITDPSKAEKWLWNMKENPELGVHITGISNGDMFAKLDFLESELESMEDSYEPIHDVLDKLEQMS